MAKADKKQTQQVIDTASQKAQGMSNAGINETKDRIGTVQPRSDSERAAINTGFSGMANNNVTYGSNGFNRPAGSESSGGGGGGGGGSAEPDYLSVFRELAGKDAGFDPTRLGNITDVSSKLRNTSGNFGATDASIGGLQDFAKTGGLNKDQLGNINRDTLTEFEKTGGYNEGDKSNIRSRANSAVPAFYQNLRDDMKRRASVSNMGPGMDRSSFKMARQAAQGSADTARDTELGISDAVRSGRMAASTELARNALGTADLQSKNTLSGYGTSGNLDLAKQGQISRDLEAGGNLDLNTQMGMNNTRLGATSGISQDTLGRMQIGAMSGSASAGRAQQQSQWEQEMAQRDRYQGNSGLLDMYNSAPAELMANQNQLMDYRKMGGDWGYTGADLRMKNAANDYGSRLGTITDKATKLISAVSGFAH